MPRMTTSLPARKVMAGTLGAAVATILAYAVQTMTGTELPEPVTGAVTVLAVFLFGYWTPPALRDTVETDAQGGAVGQV